MWSFSFRESEQVCAPDCVDVVVCLSVNRGVFVW